MEQRPATSSPAASHNAMSPAASAVAGPAGAERVATERIDAMAGSGRLPAGTVALCVAAVAAWKDEPVWLRVALGMAPRHGVAPAALRHVGSLLVLARGTCAERRYLAALAQLFPDVAAMAVSEGPGDGAGDPWAYFEAHFGSVPDRVRLLGELLPDEFVTYARRHAAALHSDVLDPAAAELVLCALNASDFQQEFLRIHVAGARRAGATEIEIAQAAYAATPFSGIAAWPAVAAAIVATRPEADADPGSAVGRQAEAPPPMDRQVGTVPA